MRYLAAGSVAAAAAALLLGGCAGGGAQRDADGPDRPQVSDPDIIAEAGPPRARARAHTDLAAAYYEIGNLGVALEEARVALAADPGYAPAYNVLGLINMDLKEPVQAQRNFERALGISPTDPDTNHNFGWFLCQTGREEEGIKRFLTAVRNPLYATPQKSYTLAGVCASRTRQWVDAAEYLERALKLDPNYMLAVLQLAHARYQLGDLASARRLVAQFNRTLEPTAESLWLALRIERKLGDKSAETALADQLMRRFTGTPESQNLQKGLYD